MREKIIRLGTEKLEQIRNNLNVQASERNVKSVLFATNCKTFNKHLIKKTPLRINNINSTMKDLISNSPLENSEKHE